MQGHRPATLRSRVRGMSVRISLCYPVKTQDLRRIDSLSVGFYPIPWRRSILEKLIIVEIRKKSLRLVWNPKALCCRLVQKSPILVPVLCQMNPVHICQPSFFKINFNSVLASTSKSSKFSLPFRFSFQNVVCISHIFHATP